VEDEGPARRRLEQMVQQHEVLTLAAALKSGREAMEKLPDLHADLLLLDIQLKDKTIFEVLDQLPIHQDSRIIFVTAYDQYAIKAFELEAIDYLLKPFDQQRFDQAIERVIRRELTGSYEDLMRILRQNLAKKQQRILIPEGKKSYHFTADDIQYIRADAYYAAFHTFENKQLIRISLKKLENILPLDFVRINKSTIVNRNHIRKIEHRKNDSTVTLKRGIEFTVSEMYVDKFEV